MSNATEPRTSQPTDRERAAKLLRNLSVLVDYNAAKRGLPHDVVLLALVIGNVKELWAERPDLIEEGLVAQLAVAAQRLDVDFSGKR